MRRIVICCDGTWNRADQARDGEPTPTNVVRLAYRVAKMDPAGVGQVVFYEQGVGTGNTIDRWTGGAFGRGLEDNIFDAYRFLVANYERGDELFFFGFSRGAFTARSLAGMVRNCGILSRTAVSRYREAVDLYRDRVRGPDHPDAVRFRREASVGEDEPVPIHFLGVWDTVGALGIPLRGLRFLTRRKYQFHDVELSGTVRAGYHALAIDEHRGPFAPTLWAHKPKPPQTVEQVWFPGAHSDVGGGYAEAQLSDIPLGWLIGKAKEHGLAFDPAVAAEFPLAPDPTGPIHNSKKGLYRLTPGIDRQIGLGPADPAEPDGPQQDDPTQSLHDSVRTRWNEEPGYRPPSLVEYFERRGMPDEWAG